MSAAQHTPGPWKVEKELSSRLAEWLITMDAGDRGRGIAIAETVPATGRELANARLIASAPELLEALKHCEDVFMRYEISRVDGEEITDKALQTIRAAIAKATGGAA